MIRQFILSCLALLATNLMLGHGDDQVHDAPDPHLRSGSSLAPGYSCNQLEAQGDEERGDERRRHRPADDAGAEQIKASRQQAR